MKASKILTGLVLTTATAIAVTAVYRSDSRTPRDQSRRSFPSALSVGVDLNAPEGEVVEEEGGEIEVGQQNYLPPAEHAAYQALINNPETVIQGEPWTGEMGITPTPEQVAEWERAEALQARSGQPRKLYMPREFKLPFMRNLKSEPDAPTWVTYPPLPATRGDDIPLVDLNPSLPQTVGTSWDAVTLSSGLSGSIPPDTMGDVGPTQYIAFVNGRIRGYTKAGSSVGQISASANTFFNSVRNGSGMSDPRIRYDRLSDRWFIVMINTAVPNRVCIAVSTNNAPTSTANFTFFFFQHDLVGTTPNADTGGFLDYPTMGVDEDAIYIGSRMFNAALTAFTGTTVHVVRKSSLLTGGPIVVTPFRQVTAASGNGPYSAMGVDQFDSGTTEGYVIGGDLSIGNRLVVRRITSPDSAPAISGNLNITVTAAGGFGNATCLGSTAPLDGLDNRLYSAMIRKNRLTGVRTLWTANHYHVNTSGGGVVASATSREGSRWYEIGSMTGTPTLIQSGLQFDASTNSTEHNFMPSIAASGQGHAAMGVTTCGNARRAEIAVSGRLATDTLGTLQARTIAQTSSTNYNVQGLPEQRWGDYSQTSVDPSDDMTFWTIQEYCNAANSWAVRVIRLIAPPPATPASCVPPTLAQGAVGQNVVLTGTAIGGSGFYDPEASFPNHLVAAVDGGGVTVNSFTFDSPTQLTLNVTVSGGAAATARTITVTNPDGQMVTSGSPILTIVPSCTMPGDVNNDGSVNGDDIPGFLACMLGGSTIGLNCGCGDFNASTTVTSADIAGFVAALGI